MSHDQREALYDAGEWRTNGQGVFPAVAQSKKTLPEPSWVDGEPVNLAAAAADADRWLEFLQAGRVLTSQDEKKLSDCRAALCRMLEA